MRSILYWCVKILDKTGPWVVGFLVLVWVIISLLEPFSTETIVTVKAIPTSTIYTVSKHRTVEIDVHNQDSVELQVIQRAHPLGKISYKEYKK